MSRLRTFRLAALKVNAFRISVFVGVVFGLIHFVLEASPLRSGFFSDRGFLGRLEYSALDAKFQARKQPLFEPHVAVAAIDEKSIDRYGLWPWNRARIGELVDALGDYGVKSMAFDVIFSDEDKNSTYRELKRFKDVYDEAGLYRKIQPAVLGQAVSGVEASGATLKALEAELKTPAQRKKLEQLSKELGEARSSLATYQEKSQRFYDTMAKDVKNLSPDEALAQAIRRHRQKIVSGYFFLKTEEETKALATAQLDRNFERIKSSGIDEVFTLRGQITRPVDEPDAARRLNVHEAAGVQAPLPLIAEASQYFGYFNVEPDSDGKLRHLPLLYRVRDLVFPSLSVQAVAVAFGGGFSPIRSETDLSRLDADGVLINGEGLFVPTDYRGAFLINYYGDPQKLIPTYSVSDIIEKKIDAGLLKDKIVFIGMTAIGGFDLRVTPFSEAMPGVYTHASGAQNMLDRRFIERFAGVAVAETIGIILLGILAGLLLPRLRIGWGALATVGFVGGLIVIDQLFIFANGIWIKTVTPILELAVIFVSTTVYRYLTEEREKKVIRNAFQFYLTKSVVDEVLKDTTKLKLGGEKRELSVLFSDIRGFTTISEKLQPEELVHLLNSYLTPMTDIVFKHEGTLDKYMGDAIMAFFGAPVDQQDHASRACFAALDMMAELRVLQARWREQNLPEIDIGVGINSGPMAVGNMGSDMRFDYTVMGDNVNLGSRLEGINKEYGSNIIISQHTYDLAKNDVYVRLLDAVRVKGKLEPVKIYELRGRGQPASDEVAFIAAFEQAIARYRAQAWGEAIAAFEACLAQNPHDYCSKKYIERCEYMREHPPGDGWDGVYTMKTK